MAGRTTSLGKQPKQGKKTTGRAKKAASNKKVPASAAAARTKSRLSKRGEGLDQDPDPDTCTKAGMKIEIREEIPEALAYFLDVYGRLGRG